MLLPDYVALFPELTTSMPAHIAASTGIDALCHLLECFTATVANPVSDNAALTGLSKLFRHIQPAVNDPQDLRAKLEMLWASYYGGVAITHAGTHLVHALSYPLGGNIICRMASRMPSCWRRAWRLFAPGRSRNLPRSGIAFPMRKPP